MFKLVFCMAILGAAPAWAADGVGVVGELEQSSTLPPKEKVAFATAAVDEIAAAEKTINKLLESARKDGDKDAVECLERKLTPVRSLLEVSRHSSNAMQSHLAANDLVHADQEYRKVAVALSKAREFVQEAQACVGKKGASKGKSDTELVAESQDIVDVTDAIIEPPVEVTTPG
jgi:hypothetical protein